MGLINPAGPDWAYCTHNFHQASTVTWLDGSTSSVYFVQGSANPFQITNIAAGGDSSGFVALYNQ